MHEFCVWAPLAKRMAVQVNGKALPMQGPDHQGWWRLRVEEAGAGTDYGFVVNEDQTPYPDPRSLHQPQGVHGLSRVYDQVAFQWTDDGFQPKPLASAIIYEMHTGTFTSEGTLDSAIAKLDALVELGITHVELLPLNAFPGVHGWGYDGVALFAVHEPYGGPDALKRFVDAAHQKGLGVLLDVVYNHFGPAGNYTGKFAPYITEEHRTPWGGAVNLEGEWAHQVRRFFCDNALMWLRDFHLDGLRLDAVHAYVDRSALHFLEQLAVEVKHLEATLAKGKVLIAESDSNDPRIVQAREGGGYGLDAQWSDDFHHALFAVLNPEEPVGYYSDFGKLGQVAKALEHTFVFDGVYAPNRKRVHGKSPAGLPQNRFLGYIQNHDQVGNRAVGERLQNNVGLERAKIAAALVLTSPFVPMLFQGEEWAASTPFQYFADHEDEELKRLVSEGRKKEFEAFGWDPGVIPDPEKPETYHRSKLNWEERGESPHTEMLDWYRALIRLRRSHVSLNDSEYGKTCVSYDEERRWLRMKRGWITVCCNLGTTEQAVKVPNARRVVLASSNAVKLEGSIVTLPMDGVGIIETEGAVGTTD